MEWMIIVTWLARIILLILILMSVYALSIILERRDFFKKFSLTTFEPTWIELSEDGKIDEIKIGLDKSNPFMNQILSAFESSASFQSVRSLQLLKFKNLEEGKASVLGTFGSTAPFIGLLGTVFGIIVAFGELSAGKVDSNSIMYALAEALILTAVGLVVAIPSVMSFNHYSRRLKIERDRVRVLQDIIRSTITKNS